MMVLISLKWIAAVIVAIGLLLVLFVFIGLMFSVESDRRFIRKMQKDFNAPSDGHGEDPHPIRNP